MVLTLWWSVISALSNLKLAGFSPCCCKWLTQILFNFSTQNTNFHKSLQRPYTLSKYLYTQNDQKQHTCLLRLNWMTWPTDCLYSIHYRKFKIILSRDYTFKFMLATMCFRYTSTLPKNNFFLDAVTFLNLL